MEILVTGGSGYIGANLVAKLLRRADVSRVIVYDNFSRRNYNALSLIHEKHGNKLKFVEADILDGITLKQALIGIDRVVHLAAVSRTPFSDDAPHYFDQINHWGTANLVSAIEDTPSVKSVVYASSAAVYGHTESPIKDTTTAPSPNTSYARSKFAGECQIGRLPSRVNQSILRLGNVIGVGKAMRFDSVFNKFFLSCVLGKPLVVEGSGNQVRPFIHIDDAVEAIERSLISDCSQGTENAVSYVWSINELVSGFKAFLPNQEVTYVNQYENLRDLNILPSFACFGSVFGGKDCQVVEVVSNMFAAFNDADANI